VVGLCVAAFSSAYILDESRYESRTTKSPELIFSALLGDDGARNMRFDRALRT
jgi:hypothetical protein